ncbi:MAG: hypothetical protein QM831_41785 [Kofleriaceae bacterium]
MRTVILVAAASRLAFAEPPGLTAPTAPQPYPTPRLQLTDDEQDEIDAGYISPGQTIGGVMMSLMGFGIGQVVEGRWHETGYIFTTGEALSITALVIGAANGGFDDACCHHNPNANLLAVGGMIAFMGFHAWEVLDAAVGPTKHNRHVYELRQRAGLEGFAVPASTGTGGVAGISLRF